MIRTLLLDFSYTLCFPKTKETIESLNGLYKQILQDDSTAQALDNFLINQELLDYLLTLRTHCRLYVFTSGTMHTDPVISHMLKPVFDGYITSIELNMPKAYPNTYKVIANKLDVTTNEILFIDDQQKNVVAAITAGANAIRYTNNTETIRQIKKLLETVS
ncbi:MAG: hypothetical protein BroJett025_08840 [Patescibacteria group bacterium]|nr:MAG: hypothetical protein BroJett025_08840 [Patescibacteria group bacterium]